MKKTSTILLFTLGIAIMALFIGRHSVKWFPNFSVRNSTVTGSYKDNAFYKEQTGYYELYSGSYDFVMFGDSHIQRVHWNELFNSCHIGNRGIGSDVSAGLLSRVQNVINLRPTVVFILCGINDIAQGVSKEDYIANMQAIADSLNSHDINVHIIHPFYVGKNYPDAAKINHKVSEFDQALQGIRGVTHHGIYAWAEFKKGAPYMEQEYLQGDNIHLNAKGLKILSNTILPYLRIPVKLNDPFHHILRTDIDSPITWREVKH